MRFLVLLALVVLSNSSYAAIGKITDQTNAPPSITRKTSNISGTKGTGLEMDDTIKTTQGKVGITFDDDTKVQITENSKLVIDSFVYDPSNKAVGKLSMKVAMGTVRYASGAVAHNNPNAVAINTPTATIAVRGTDFTATVDELGRSTIILLPSCRKGWTDIKKDCITGEISVTTEEGTVILNQPFQATRVEARERSPIKPLTLNLTEDQINNILILSPPKELRHEEHSERGNLNKSALDIDFLKETGLANAFDSQSKEEYANKLDRNPLDNAMLPNILDLISAQMAAYMDFLSKSTNKLLPDYKPSSGVIAEVDDLNVTLYKEFDGDVQSVTVNKNSSLTIYQENGAVSIKNRVNSDGNTTIRLRQQ